MNNKNAMYDKRRSGVKCIVKSCRRSYRNGSPVKMFRFPKKESLRRQWIEKCGLPRDFKMRAVICDSHFEKESIGKRFLKSNVVPTLNLFDPSDANIVISKKLGGITICKDDDTIEDISICRSFVDTPPDVECRACLTSSVALVDIFDDQRQPSLADMLNECVTSIAVQRNDELPQKMCLSCICDLQTAFDFQRRCKESHQVLSEKLNKIKMESTINMEMPEEDVDIVRLRMEIDELLSSGDKLPEDQMEFMPEDERKANSPISIFSSRDVNTAPAYNSNQRQSSRLLDDTNLNNSEVTVRSELIEIESWELAEQDNELGCSKVVKDKEDSIKEQQTECTVERHETGNPLAVDEPGRNTKKMNKYSCPQCRKACTCKSALKLHLRSHTDERPYKCPHCPKAYKQFTGLLSHIYTHGGKTAFKCHYCRRYFLEKAKLDEHVRYHIGYRAYKCPHCPKICTAFVYLKKHIRTHYGENSEVCNPIVVNKPRIETKNGKFICPHCPKAYTLKSSLRNHISKHSDKRSFKCPHCPKKYKMSWNLRIHILSHEGKTALKCPHCRKYFLEKAKLDEHTRYHIGHRAYKCPHCPKIYTHPSFFKDHIASHPADNKAVNVQSERNENSELAEQDNEIGCTKAAKGKEDNIREQQTERSSKSSEECNVERNSPAVHGSEIAAKEKQFKCAQCPKAYKNKSSLKIHMRTHLDEPPLQCPHCPKTFKKSANLRTHIFTHAGETPLKCLYCRKYFLEKAEHDEHARFHVGPRAYKCPHCPKVCHRRNLRKHIMTHTKKNVEE
ncbi:zinc finger protein 888-like [Drosophila novamexicana]|uniref:zinc finger protein 888-like n=1 Tax=Drosophila novamexicana TaxID=47314 RepID=UPI0011E5F429|nr:zinc finger protein 888-like [Drosophila novamexicana]